MVLVLELLLAEVHVLEFVVRVRLHVSEIYEDWIEKNRNEKGKIKDTTTTLRMSLSLVQRTMTWIHVGASIFDNRLIPV